MAKRVKKVVEVEPVKLRIGAGSEPGFTTLTVGQFMEAHYADNSIDEIFCANQFHRLTLAERHEFMNEASRVLIPTNSITVAVPYYTSYDAYSDPLAQMPPVAEASFLVYSKAWRAAWLEGEGLPLWTLDHITANFGQNIGGGHVPTDEMAVRPDDYRAFHSKHSWNSVAQLRVILTKLTT